MTVLGIAALVVYGIGWVVTARLVAGHIAYSSMGTPDAETWVMCGAMGVLLGAFWPLLVAGVLLLRAPLLPRSPKERRAANRAKEVELREREERVRALERELGVAQKPSPLTFFGPDDTER